MGNSTAEVDGSSVTLSEISEIVRRGESGKIVALKALLEHTQRKAVKKVTRTTVALRKDQLARALAGQDDEKLEKVDAAASGLVEEFIANETIITGTGTLTPDEAKALMQEFLHAREVDEAIDARSKGRKIRVFDHMDAVLASSGVTDPQNHNATLEVPELGFKFCREGAGYKDPGLDVDLLQAVLGDEVWASICDEVEVPAHVEHTLNETKLLDLAHADDNVMLKLAECLTPGAEKTPKLVPREL